MAKTKSPTVSKRNPRDERKKLGLNQQQFWSRIGVTQSGGSRYESGRSIPKPVQILIELAYGKKAIDTFTALRGKTLAVSALTVAE